MPPAPLIAYIRVSTSGQGRSGLGIEAQRHTLTQFARTEGFEIAREFVEVETGKGSDALDRRPQLKAALAVARKLKCHVAVARQEGNSGAPSQKMSLSYSTGPYHRAFGPLGFKNRG